MWCRRRRPRRRPRELEGVPGARCCRTHRSTTPRLTPPAKTSRRKTRPLPQRGERRNVTPRIQCTRCLPVIRLHFHVICLRVAFYHVIMCISFCIRVHLMHPSIFPVVRFAIRHSYTLRRSPFVSCCERVLNILGMVRDLPSCLGIAPVDLLSSFVPFGGRLILQRLTT